MFQADETSEILAKDGWVLSGGRDGAVDNEYTRLRIWDVAKAKLVRALKGHKEAITSITYKPDLRVILSGSLDQRVLLWQPWDISNFAADDQSYKTFSGYTFGVTDFGVTAKGVKMVSASEDGYIHVWDIDQGISLAKGGIRGVFFAIVGLIVAYPLGALIDRWNPLRTILCASLIGLPAPILFYFFYHDYVTGFYLTILYWPFNVLAGMAMVPMLVMLLPRAKYGQFCSANALVRQAVGAVAAPSGAVVMDYLTRKSLNTDAFRYGYLCQFVAHVLSLLCLLGVYYYWKKLGGKNYTAPEAEGLPKGEPDALPEPAN